MVKSWNQASPDFAHSKSWERQGFFNGRYEVDFDNACTESVRRSRERAHDVNHDYDTASLTCAVHAFNDSSDHACGSSGPTFRAEPRRSMVAGRTFALAAARPPTASTRVGFSAD